jgi:hypothetical protein
MTFSEDELEELKGLYGGIQTANEGGDTYFFIVGLPLPEGCNPGRVDALLCPMPRDGYPSRLFFAERPSSRSSPNWNGQVRILERNWFAFSWKITASERLRLAQIVQAHLRGLR